MSLFQRRHYYKIGDLLIDVQGYLGLSDEVFEPLVDSFVDMFTMDNPNFNYNLFLDHVGVKAE